MTDTLLRLAGVGYAYRGGAGVQDVDLDVAPGEVHALVGLNGAGKSTLMKLVLGMLRPQRGAVEVLGKEVGAAGREVWAAVGALVEYPLAYGELDASTNLALAARLHGVAPRDVAGTVDAVLDELDLATYAGVLVRRLSAGNAQRVGLAAALPTAPGCSCSTNRRPRSTRPGSSCCARRCSAVPRRARASSSPATISTRSPASPTGSRSSPRVG